MRPLRLVFEGFGSYRDHTDVQLSDVDFFVLTGPTGSGKSTVIDALCFALYGTVPRWGKGNVIRNALAPSVNEGRVCLVFEAAGGRYAAARQLRRDARGNVHTKEARLDRLDESVPLDADLAKLLELTVEQTAEGPDSVTAAVTELLGIGYEHFTQCVLLPQGRFAEFLHAKPGDRQDLLIQLLAYSVYEQVGQRARERGKAAAGRLALAEERLAGLGAVADADVEALTGRVTALAALAPLVDAAVEEMASLRERWTAARQRAVDAGAALESLAALRMPADVAELSTRLLDADAVLARCVAARDEADELEATADAALAGHAAREALVRLRDAHARSVALAADLARGQSTVDGADAAERDAASALASAEEAVGLAEAALAAAEQAHAAAALAAHVRPGEPCPVCLRTVGSAPHHDVPADLDRARSAVTQARRAAGVARIEHATAGKTAAAARAAVAEVQRQLTEVQAVLAQGRLASVSTVSRPQDVDTDARRRPAPGPGGAPTAAEVDAALAERDAADAALTEARSAARKAREAAAVAARDRDALREAEQRAWAALRAGRDRLVALAAPAVDGTDLLSAWQSLIGWAAARREALATEADELTAAEAALRTQGTEAAAALTRSLAEHGVDVAQPEAAKAPVFLAQHRERADRDLADLLARRERSTALAEEITAHREERQVADLLGNLLRSDGFERWLCAEALDSLVTEASATRLQRSGGQSELVRGARNELPVNDHNDAGTQRPVHTLSGGETFQASLALALALSRQVVGLSGGRRDLNSMFLDEGFGTLDESTLDIVASTLERLAEESDCMVGIVTHVPALAERVPVQFAVSREGASSRLRRVGV